MPLVDIPLHDLQAYQGRNPRPLDFEAYWARAIEEMRATDPQIELVSSAFSVPNVDCFDLYFTGVRGARIHAQYLRPQNVVSPHPAILQFHGYKGNAGDWSEKLAYTSFGYSVLAMDCRGQGGLSEDTGGVRGTTYRGHIVRGLDDHPDNLLFRHIMLDAAQLAGIAMELPEVDPDRIGVFGWSQGGALTVACAALEPRVQRLAPVYPFLCDYKRTWEMDLGGCLEEIVPFFRNHDPQHLREDDIFTRLGYIDIQHLAEKIRGQVLWGVGLMDTVCPPSTQFAVFNKITSAKRMEVFPDFGHESLPKMSDKIAQFMLEL
ncbi:acetylxylan esterase [Alicyclobacillus fastidiosus]|uniref:Alpha/beta fold hydrolase n=1 Tax=Alicyclobacillus fastidiosus TaxID=392011 RepID=A0ABV5AMQ3_9BACL|nr:acetylxylan esterase [Alicyclobacillus fastidiosus]WEH08854.1 alpha/beta fold hydrolase [Alicyclobacillus fastidiosus]